MDMTKGYDRAVFFEMLRIVAWNPSYHFGLVEYSEDGKTSERLTLVRYIQKLSEAAEEEKRALTSLYNIKSISESRERATALFNVSILNQNRS